MTHRRALEEIDALALLPITADELAVRALAIARSVLAEPWSQPYTAIDNAFDACQRELAQALAQLTAIREAAEPARQFFVHHGWQLYLGGLGPPARELLAAIDAATEPLTLRCETCRTEMRASAFRGECPVCGNGTVREIEGSVAE